MYTKIQCSQRFRNNRYGCPDHRNDNQILLQRVYGLQSIHGAGTDSHSRNHDYRILPCPEYRQRKGKRHHRTDQRHTGEKERVHPLQAYPILDSSLLHTVFVSDSGTYCLWIHMRRQHSHTEPVHCTANHGNSRSWTTHIQLQ